MAYLCISDNGAPREALDAPDASLVSRHRDYVERMRTAHPHTEISAKIRAIG